MDGLCRAIGSPAPFVVDGKTYLASPLTLLDYGTFEFHIISHRVAPVDSQEFAGLNARQLLMMSSIKEQDIARAGRITFEVLLDWLETDDGILFSGWLCLRKQHPEFTGPDAVKELLTSPEAKRAFVTARDAASGIDSCSAIDWPRPKSSDRLEIEWRTFFSTLITGSLGSKWSLQEIGNMTMYQVRIVTSTKGELQYRRHWKDLELEPEESITKVHKTLTDHESVRIHQMKALNK